LLGIGIGNPWMAGTIPGSSPGTAMTPRVEIPKQQLTL